MIIIKNTCILTTIQKAREQAKFPFDLTAIIWIRIINKCFE
jgi:hypothetical protein